MINTLNITGTVKSFGEKGTTFKKLWIALEIINKKTGLPSTAFINFDLDSNTNSKKYKLGEFIKSRLEKGRTIFVCDATIKPIKISKPDGAGGWVAEEKTGVTASLGAINFIDNPIPTNIVLLDGKITKQDENKLIIEQSYRLPVDNTWKTRSLPVLISAEIDYMFKDAVLVGKNAFVHGELVATDKSIYVSAKTLIAT